MCSNLNNLGIPSAESLTDGHTLVFWILFSVRSCVISRGSIFHCWTALRVKKLYFYTLRQTFSFHNFHPLMLEYLLNILQLYCSTGWLKSCQMFVEPQWCRLTVWCCGGHFRFWGGPGLWGAHRQMRRRDKHILNQLTGDDQRTEACPVLSQVEKS